MTRSQILSVLGLDSDGKVDLTQIGAGDLDNIDDGTTHGKVKNDQLTNNEVIFQTADKDGLNVANYEGRVVYDTGENRHYRSDGTNWNVVDLSDQEVWEYGTRKLTALYKATKYADDSSFLTGTAIVPSANRRILAAVANFGVIYFDYQDVDGNWRRLRLPNTTTDVQISQNFACHLQGGVNCDGTNHRIYNGSGSTAKLRYYYQEEDT
jgi:hypothetical protein